jgi:hypothetical protein
VLFREPVTLAGREEVWYDDVDATSSSWLVMIKLEREYQHACEWQGEVVDI